MGAEPYWYFVDYEQDIDHALQELRKREFMAGRYNPVMDFIEFPLGPNSPSPGAAHNSIEEAMEASMEDGTRSILDIQSVADAPDCCVAVPLGNAVLQSIFGTTEPSRQMIEEKWISLEGWIGDTAYT